MKINVIKHPLIEHKLTHLRNKNTRAKEFKEFLEEISRLMSYEVFKIIKLKEIVIETPISKTKGKIISEKINLYPILRAGEGMLAGFREAVPNARIGHIGLYREEKTLKPIQYLFKYPKDTAKDTCNIIIDPIIATGGSMIKALDILKKSNMENIIVVGLLASQEALQKIDKAHPDIEIFIISDQEKLNKNGYLEPGIGDAGDRIFGTK